MGKILGVFGTHDEKTLAQLEDVASRAEYAALMADGHLGYVMPIGGVAAYKNKVSVTGVGFDIACGNAAIKTDLLLNDLVPFVLDDIKKNPSLLSFNSHMNKLADEIFNQISFGIGRKNLADDAPTDHQLFRDPAMWIIPNIGGYRDDLIDKARKQLGTIGSGNHYVDVFVGTDNYIWVGVHFGSRGFGHTIASAFLALSQGGNWGDRVKETEALLDLDTQLGQDYFALMNLAGEYAYAGREWVARKVVSILGGKEVDLVHNHHNFAWIEDIPLMNGFAGLSPYVVVRKGATPAYPGQRGFIGGSMGDDAVIIEGTDTDKLFGPNQGHDWTTAHRMGIWIDQEKALYSTVHGAGRVMSRTEAAGKWKKGKQVKRGKISHEDQSAWLAKRGTILRGAGLDEAPQAYRRLPEVLTAQGQTIQVLETLRPLIVCMAPANEKDPYKD